MKEMPKKDEMVTFRRPFKDPQVRVGQVVKVGPSAVAVATGVKGSAEEIELFLPISQVFQVR